MYPIRICIEGNIAAGKHEIMDILKENFSNNRTIFLSNNLNNWKNKELLFKFFNETTSHSFFTELKSSVEKINTIKNNKKQVIFFEKSWVTDKNCFAKTLYELNYMTKDEYELYVKTYNLISKPNVDLIIYVKSEPTVCYEKILSRKINYENNITMNFIVKLSGAYNEWAENCPVPILEVDLVNLNRKEFIDNIFERIPKFSRIYNKFV